MDTEALTQVTPGSAERFVRVGNKESKTLSPRASSTEAPQKLLSGAGLANKNILDRLQDGCSRPRLVLMKAQRDFF